MVKFGARQCIVAQGRTPEEFADVFNAKTAALAKEGYRYEVEYVLDKNLAYIFYEKKYEVPETLRDEYYIKTGRVYLCAQCPYYMPAKDRRRRGVPCMYATHLIGPESGACDIFYERFAPDAGEIKEGEGEYDY